MALTRVAPAGIGSTPGTGYVIGDSFLHSRGLNATDGYYTGIVTTQSLRVLGDLEVEGTTTTLDTALTEVDKLEVGANNNTVGVAITQSGTGDILSLYDGSTQVVTVKDGGNVGIGTDGPTALLNVYGETSPYILVEDGSPINNQARINFKSPSYEWTTGLHGGESGKFKISYNSAHGDNDYLTITTTGAVGIGTVNPNNPLTVYASGNHIYLKDTATDNNLQIRSSGGVAEFNSFGTGGARRDFVFNQYTSEVLRITSDGKVGIGTDNPGAKLHTYGNAIIENVGGITLKLRRDDISTAADRLIGAIQFEGNDSNGAYETGAIIKASTEAAHGTGDKPSRLEFHTTPDNSATPVERLRITSGGNLLLGRTSDYWSSRTVFQEDKDGRTHLLVKNDNNHASASAGITLNAFGNSWAIDCGSHPNNTNALTFGLDASAGSPAEKLRITSDGKVGIGTDNPRGGLHVFSDATGELPATSHALVVSRASSASNRLLLGIDENSGYGVIASVDPGTTWTHTTINPTTGNVGIGLTNPSAKLHISSGSATQMLISNKSASMSDGDTIGTIDFTAGTSFTTNARVAGLVEGTSEAGGDLVFETRADGGSLTEKVRIRSDGKLMTQSAGYVYTASSAGSLSLYGGNTNLGGGIVLGGGNDSADVRFLAQASTATPAERMRITSAGKVLINSTDNSNNATMVVRGLTDNNHPIIKVRGTNANGYTFLGDDYSGGDESQFTMGLAYSGASIVTGWGVRVSTSANDTYVSSQDTYSTKHSAIKHDSNGWRFLSNSTSQTVTTGSTVTLTERLRITSAGDVGIGEDGPTARLHVRSTGITAGAPSEGWPDWNADNDNNAKIVALLETGGNGDNATSGHGASVVLRLGQYYDSRAVISPTPGGGASPSDQGVGHGKDLMVKGGRSDNGNGRNGGRLFLDGGGGFDSGSFGNLIGDVILQSQGGYIGLNGQTNPEYPFDLIDGNNRAYFTAGSDSTMSLVLYDNTNHRVSIQGYGGQLRLNTTPTSGGSFESCMRFNTDGDAIIGSGFNEDPTSNRRLVVKDTNSIIRIESPGSSSGEYTQLEFKTGGTNAWIWKNPTSNTGYGGADSLNIYQSQNASIAFLTNGNNVRFNIRGDGQLEIGSSGTHFVRGEYRGTISVTNSNTDTFAFRYYGSGLSGGGKLFVGGTSGNVVVNAIAEILVNHSGDIQVQSLSGAYTQARIRVVSDANHNCDIYLGRSGGYGSGTTSLSWRFIPYTGYVSTSGGTYNSTTVTHGTSSGSFNLTGNGGSQNVNASGTKNFLIDHPLESLRETTRLAHAAVEGPECNTIYRGKVDLVDGTATVNIDTNSRMTEGTFVALNQNVQCFTTNETGWTSIKGSVSGNLLTITAQDNTCTDTISWMVVGERHDQSILINRATDSEGRFIPEVTDEYDASQFAEYTDPVEPEPEPDNTEERDPTV